MEKKILFAKALVLLAACSSYNEDLSQWTNDVRQKAKNQKTDSQELSANQFGTYTPPPNDGGLNAFDSKRLDVPMEHQQGVAAPDDGREKEILENFNLERLKYVGSLSHDRWTSGYVEVDGRTYTVRIGNYMGKNYGRIKEITPRSIILVELVKDHQGNWTYRDTELLIGSSTENTASQNNK